MQIEHDKRGAVSVIRPTGPLIGSDAPSLLGAVREQVAASFGRFVLDLSRVPFVDSQGLEALADAGQELETTGLGLKVCGANEVLREVFELTGVNGLFEQYADVQSAVRTFL